MFKRKSISEYSDDLKQHIGMMFQETNIYALTLEENLSLYGPVDHISEVLKKCDLESLESYDSDMPMTREFEEKGIVLSGGQKQKLALGRLMQGSFGLLILDEPSASLDPLSEKKMMDEISRISRNTTTIMIVHRLSTVRNADCIYVLDNGRIAESGTHDQLMSENGLYRKMFTNQAEEYKR